MLIHVKLPLQYCGEYTASIYQWYWGSYLIAKLLLNVASKLSTQSPRLDSISVYWYQSHDLTLCCHFWCPLLYDHKPKRKKKLIRLPSNVQSMCLGQYYHTSHDSTIKHPRWCCVHGCGRHHCVLGHTVFVFLKQMKVILVATTKNSSSSPPS